MGRRRDALARRDELPLVARRQPLGILPTPSFWLDREVLRLALPFRLVIGAVVFGVVATLLTLIPGAPVWFFVGAGFSTAMLGLGLLERYIRHRANRRALPRGR